MASFLDSGLSGALVDNENQRVVVLDRLDGALRAQRILDDCVLVPSALLFDGLLDGDGLARKGLRLGQLERDFGPDLLFSCRVGTLLNS